MARRQRPYLRDLPRTTALGAVILWALITAKTAQTPESMPAPLRVSTISKPKRIGRAAAAFVLFGIFVIGSLVGYRWRPDDTGPPAFARNGAVLSLIDSVADRPGVRLAGRISVGGVTGRSQDLQLDLAAYSKTARSLRYAVVLAFSQGLALHRSSLGLFGSHLSAVGCAPSAKRCSTYLLHGHLISNLVAYHEVSEDGVTSGDADGVYQADITTRGLNLGTYADGYTSLPVSAAVTDTLQNSGLAASGGDPIAVETAFAKEILHWTPTTFASLEFYGDQVVQIGYLPTGGVEPISTGSIWSWNLGSSPANIGNFTIGTNQAVISHNNTRAFWSGVLLASAVSALLGLIGIVLQ